MRFTTTAIALCALAATSTLAQAPAAAPTNMTAGAGAMPSLDQVPQCFKACADTAAKSKEVGCQGLMDLKCTCSKPNFQAEATKCIMSSNDNECPKLKQNQTAMEDGAKMLQGICAQVAQGGNSTMAGGAAPQSSSGGSASASMSASGSVSGSAKKNGAATVAPNFVASAAVLVSALSAGVYVLV